MSRPTITVLATGGTISGIPDGTGVEPGLTAEALLALVPGLGDRVVLRSRDVARISSRAMTVTAMCEFAHRVAEAREEGADGVVVTHGTDTMEESVYALALQLPRGSPIVMTGAMRVPHAAGADGPANLAAAVRVAATPDAGRLGPVVVIQDEVHLARWVAKTHTSRVGAFSSPDLGAVGTVVEDRVHLAAVPLAEDHLGLPGSITKRVELLWVAAGADGMLVRAAAEHADGLVVAGTGGGHMPPDMLAAAAEVVADGRPVVLASRTGAGALLAGTYAGPGSEREVAAAGVLPAGRLSPLKARLRLLIALELGRDPAAAFPV